MIRKKGKAGKGNVHLIILYRGNLSVRGKRGIVAKGRERRCRREGNLPRKGGKGGLLRKGGKGDAEGRGIYREREEKGHFGEEKGMFRGRERGVSGRK
ncbi:hypothetical protein K0H44_22720, partial [Bacteroides fragilis]|nr:hypothetical protein [Bacteroides fragilis]